MSAADWIVSKDTGVSSKCIWAAVMGATPEWVDVPHDADDFGRCYRLLHQFGWHAFMPKVGERYPEWVGVAREWAELEAIYESGERRALADRLNELREEGLLAAGWTRSGAHSFFKDTGRKTQVVARHEVQS